jgi:hypothetical protein
MSGMEHLISKTDYLIYRECPKNAWLKIHRPDIYYKSELSEFEKSIIETGNEVETVARGLFPTGILIEGRDENSQAITKKHIADKTPTLFQPVVVKDSFLAALDILKLEPDGYHIIEIKASNEIKEKLHLYDLAFQYVLLKKAGIDVKRMHILHLNSDYVRQGALDIAKLFKIDDVTEAILDLASKVKEEMDHALEYLSRKEEPSGPCSCVYKGRSGHCTTFSYSNPFVPEYSIHDIARIGVSKAKLIELADRSIFKIEDIPEDIELSEIQQNQVNTHITGRTIIKQDKIDEQLESLAYPLYFIDYETFPAAIPRFDGFSPYQQIPFQYSLHIARALDTEPEHLEFLYTGIDDPSLSFGESLKKNIGPIGTIIVWNKKFEMKINTELARRRPKFHVFIKDLNSRIYDLMDIFSKQYYVHKDFQGSTSIKAVLPVLVPELTYKKLEIREGGTATQKWNEMTTGNLSSIEKEKIAADLKEYCKLDTFAMYAIWKHL